MEGGRVPARGDDSTILVERAADRAFALLSPDAVDAALSPAATGPARADLHLLLLGLAGRVRDDGLTEMRLRLADEETQEMVFLLAALLDEAAGRIGLTAAEDRLVRHLLREYDVAPGLADRVPRIGVPPSPYRFGDRDGNEIPGDGRQTRTDAADAVAIEVGQRVGGLNAIWRVFRHSGDEPARRIYLVEAEPDVDLGGLAGEMSHALAESAEDAPQVEVFAEGTPLPPYHEAALRGATLVWAAFDISIKLARAFDGADAREGPFFHPGHPRLSGDDRERVLRYLRGGEAVLDVPGALDDVLDPGRVEAVPTRFHSDGWWVWPEAAAYYLERHGLAPEPDLVAHALTGPAEPPQLNWLIRHRVLTTLFERTGGEPVWQPG
jgi:hypothetical protein